jgi:NAD(P)H-dependent FMN reductase
VFHILAISGSLRAQSSNTEVLRAAAALAPESMRVEFAPALDSLPHFNPDLDAEGATPPAAVRELRTAVGAADALLICSPEYAHGVPGSLKNALDWLVSGPEMVYKPVGLLNASPRSMYAQESLAETLRTMSAVVVRGASLDIPVSGRSLDAAAILANPQLTALLHSALESLSGAVTDQRGKS